MIKAQVSQLSLQQMRTPLRFRTGLTLLLVCALSALGLVACGGQQQMGANSNAATAGGKGVTVVALDNKFESSTYSATAGSPFKLTVTNSGQNVHEVEVEGIFAETKLAPGQSKTLDVPAPKEGNYKLYCEIHEDEGMVGEFVVK